MKLNLSTITGQILTSEDRQPPFGREISLPGGIKDVDLVRLPADAKQFSEEVLRGGTVLLCKPIPQVSPQDGGLSHPWRTENHDAFAVLWLGEGDRVFLPTLSDGALPCLAVEDKSRQLIKRGPLAGVTVTGQLPHGGPCAHRLVLFPLGRGHFQQPQPRFEAGGTQVLRRVFVSQQDFGGAVALSVHLDVKLGSAHGGRAALVRKSDGGDLGAGGDAAHFQRHETIVDQVSAQ